MLLDINAHVGHWPFKQLQYNTCESLLNRMSRFGVDASVVTNLNGIFYKNVQASNEELQAEIRSLPSSSRERLIPFAVINPIYSGWKDDLEICFSKMGMKGIHLYPRYHDYKLTDPACIELVNRVRDLGLPVALTIRVVDSRQRSWLDLADEWELNDVMPIVREVPDAKYLILNVANSVELSGPDEQLLRRAELVFDTSGRSLTNLGDLLQRFGTNKFAFGTHTPILDYLTGRLRIESLKPEEADETVQEQLRSGNALRILGR
jgi:predicted TIM-barrel fold metal-dependent hydrolase